MFKKLVKIVLLTCVSAGPLAIVSSSADACTRILWADSKSQCLLVGRTLDWQVDIQSNLWMFPRGMVRESLIHHDNPLVWTSKYASIIASAYDIASLDGLNEKGLAGHMLWLNEADYGQRHANLPAMSVSYWLQYYLDNFATVSEALTYTQAHPYELWPVYFSPEKSWVKFHLALEDASGDSAIIEIVNGKTTVYHGSNYKVMTNSPVYSAQLQNIKHYQGLGGQQNLPGSTVSADRFARATYYTSVLQTPASSAAARYALESVLNNVTEPMENPALTGKRVSPTYWYSIIDLTTKTYYFKYLKNPSWIWVSFNDFNVQAGAPVMMLNTAKQIGLSGDVSKDFKAVKAFIPFETPEGFLPSGTAQIGAAGAEKVK